MFYLEENKEEVATVTSENKEAVTIVTSENKEAVVKSTETLVSTADSKPGFKKPDADNKNNAKRTGGPRRKGGRPNNRRDSEFEEKVVDIARVTTVVKGGRRFSFSAVVVIGNKKGKVGYGHGKANEVPNAIKKAIKDAKSNLITVPIIDKRTVPHEQVSKFLASTVLVKPAAKGRGIIASSAVRSVVELAGYKDIVTKSLGSRSKANTVKAAIEALKSLRTIEQVAQLRDLKPTDIKG